MFGLTLKQITILVGGTNSEARLVALDIARQNLHRYSATQLTEDDWIDVNDVKVQKLFYAARTIDNFDHPRFVTAAQSARLAPSHMCSVDNYELLDLLGINGLIPNIEHSYVRPCRHILTSDGEIVPLPRDIDYSSQVLNDSEEIYDDSPMPVPFSRQQVLNCFDRWFRKDIRCCDDAQLLDFLGCHELIGTIKNASLSEEDWKQVLTFKPCFEQHLSGYRFNEEGALVKKDKDGNRNKIWKTDKGFHFKFRGRVDLDAVHTASRMETVVEVHTRDCVEYLMPLSQSVITENPLYPLCKKMGSVVIDSCRRLSVMYMIGIDVQLSEDRAVYTRSGVQNRLRLMNFMHPDGSRGNFLVVPSETTRDMWWVTPM